MKKVELTEREWETVLDALNVRALDRQSDEYGDGMADNAADLLARLGREVDEANAYPVG